MFIRIFRWLRGYVYIMLSGECPERLLNILGARRLPFWEIKRLGGGIRLCMFASHIKKLPFLRRGTGISVKIVSKRGLPFFLRRYRRRKGAAIGISFFLLLHVLLSQFIWNINIEGNTTLSDDTIIQYLASHGITEGSYAKGIDCDDLRLRLAMDIKEVSWASLTVEGGCLTVSVHERSVLDTSPQKPCNLVAARDGVIGDIRVLSGKTMVKKGDTVSKGQLLVSGVLEYSTGNTDLVASKGEIFAFTTRNVIIKQPLEYVQTRRTGNILRRRALNFFGLKVPLYLGNITFPYEKHTEYQRLETDSAYLPIGLYTATFYETEQQLISLTEEQAKNAALKKMDAFCGAITDFEILSYTDSIKIEDGYAVLTRHIQAKENIAATDFLQFDDAKE